MRKYFLLCFFFINHMLSAQSDSMSFHKNKVDSLINLTRSFVSERQFNEANKSAKLAIKTGAEIFGENSMEYGDACFNYGRTLHIQNELNAAIDWYNKAKIIRGDSLGHEHPIYANCLNNLAVAHKSLGNYETAENLYLKTISIRKKAFGEKDPEYAKSLRNLAVFYFELSRYEEAEPLYKEAKKIFGASLGKDHYQYARCIDGLAGISEISGNFQEAEQLYLEALNILQNEYGTESVDYAVSQLNLGIFHNEYGNYETAEKLYLSAQEIFKKELGEKDELYLLCNENLATLKFYTKKYNDAEAGYIQSLELIESSLGKNNIDYARILDKLATLYTEQLLFEKAEPFYLKSIQIREELLDRNHPDCAHALNNYADHFLIKGDYEKAEPLFLESYRIWKNAFGERHQYFITSLNSLADLYNCQNHRQKAADYFSETTDLQKSLLTKAIHHLSEFELNKYQQSFLRSQAKLLSFVLNSNEKINKTNGVAYNDILFYKGFLLNASSQLRQLTFNNNEAQKKLNELKSYQRRIASEVSLPATERNELETLEEKANTLEKELRRTVAPYGNVMQQVNWQEIRNQLKSDEVALEFIHFDYYDKIFKTDTVLYAALIVRKNNPHPLFISLFEEKQLDSLTMTNGERRADYVNQLYTIDQRGARSLERPQKTLYELIWQPLEHHLKEINTIYFSPSGLLHRINLGAVPINEDQTIADHFNLVELGSTRQMVIPSTPQKENNEAVLFGGIEYEMDSTAIAKANLNYSAGELAVRGRMDFSMIDTNSRGGTWQYLRYTEREVDALAEILVNNNVNIEKYNGYRATEEAFKNIGNNDTSPRILHIATHGYFFSDPDNGSDESEPIFKKSDHPMIRSGLIMAGGNYAWQTGTALGPHMEDGVLTAHEISQLNLSNTELVVLSACETGLGDIKGNEGVYGLQRAFKIAGAKYLIMSLWQVPDYQTHELMTTFYSFWIGQKMTIPKAFQAAQNEMRVKYRDPYFWAGFILYE